MADYVIGEVGYPDPVFQFGWGALSSNECLCHRLCPALIVSGTPVEVCASSG
jgi:hypothetical protein